MRKNSERTVVIYDNAIARRDLQMYMYLYAFDSYFSVFNVKRLIIILHAASSL